MSEGWIKLHRKIQSNPLWTSEPFTRGQAWVDLILLANHKRGYVYVRDHKIEVKRGQVGWSQRRLSQRWHWSRTKVRKFLKDLEKEQQIKQEKSHSYTVITLINYDDYQEKEPQESHSSTTGNEQKHDIFDENRENGQKQKPQKNNDSDPETNKTGGYGKTKKPQKSHRKATGKPQENTNKNVKNVKNDKKYIPTPQDVKEYFQENGYSLKAAKKFYNYYQTSVKGTQKRYWRDSKGNKVRNWKQKAQAVWFTEENKIQKDESLYDTNKLRGITG